MREFPVVKVIRNGERFEAVAALELKSILKADLLQSQTQDKAGGPTSGINSHSDFLGLQGAREAFHQAILSWTPNVILEWRYTVLPNLESRPQGGCWITLVMRIIEESESLAREKAFQTFLDLTPLLWTCFGEAELAPVKHLGSLEEKLNPFSAGYASSIRRRREVLSLSAPLKKISVGFSVVDSGAEEASDCVDHVYPWIPSHDSWSLLLNFLSGLLDPTTILIRLRPCPDCQESIEELRGDVVRCESYLSRLQAERFPIEKAAAGIRDSSLTRLAELRDGGFDLGVFAISPQPLHPSIVRILGASISKSPYHDGKISFDGGFSVQEEDPSEVLKAGFFTETAPFTAREAACAFRLPNPPTNEIPGLPIRHFRTNLATLSVQERDEDGLVRLFVNEHQGIRQEVSMGVTDRMRHQFIVGQTGTGKSTLMENLVLQDIHAGRGVAVIDPHGDAVENILASIPEERAADVILFDLLDRDRPIGFNVLRYSTPEERDLIIDDLYVTIDRIYNMKSTGGPMFELHFRGMLKLLMGDGSAKRKGFTPTLLDFVTCYVSSSFRNWLKETLDDQQVSDFILEAEQVHGEASLPNMSPYITSKFNRFVNDVALQRILGQERTAFDFDDVMNNGKIFLVKLGKGRFGSTVSALLTNMIVSRFKMAAMKRGEKPALERRDFFLYVDEAHNLPEENFMELLSEARKYRLALTLSTQYCAQLNQRPALGVGNSLLAAINGNVGTTVIFRLGSEDARNMACLLYPHFNEMDLVSLPNFHGYTRALLSAESCPPFSFISEPNRYPKDIARAERIRTQSRMSYGEDQAEVVNAIARRRKLIRKLCGQDEED